MYSKGFKNLYETSQGDWKAEKEEGRQAGLHVFLAGIPDPIMASHVPPIPQGNDP